MVTISIWYMIINTWFYLGRFDIVLNNEYFMSNILHCMWEDCGMFTNSHSRFVLEVKHVYKSISHHFVIFSKIKIFVSLTLYFFIFKCVEFLWAFDALSSAPNPLRKSVKWSSAECSACHRRLQTFDAHCRTTKSICRRQSIKHPQFHSILDKVKTLHNTGQ